MSDSDQPETQELQEELQSLHLARDADSLDAAGHERIAEIEVLLEAAVAAPVPTGGVGLAFDAAFDFPTAPGEALTEAAASNEAVDEAPVDKADELDFADTDDVMDFAEEGDFEMVESQEAAPEAPLDAAPEAPLDAAPEAPLEAAPEAPIEAAPEAPLEAAGEARLGGAP